MAPPTRPPYHPRPMSLMGRVIALGARPYILSIIVTSIIVGTQQCGTEPCEGDLCATGGTGAGDGGQGGSAGEGGVGGEATTGGGGSGADGGAGGGGTGGATTSSEGGGGTATTSSTTTAEPTCSDGAANGDETDVDCGGSCGPCPYGGKCAPGGCEPGLACTNGVCACKPATVLISEIQAAGSQEPGFVELYNPPPGTFSDNVLLRINDVEKWSGALVLGPDERKTISVGSPVTGRAVLSYAGGAPVLDIVCWCQGNDCNVVPHPTCEGSQAVNPAVGSIERKPFGVNCIDTGVHADDFAAQSSPNPAP